MKTMNTTKSKKLEPLWRNVPEIKGYNKMCIRTWMSPAKVLSLTTTDFVNLDDKIDLEHITKSFDALSNEMRKLNRKKGLDSNQKAIALNDVRFRMDALLHRRRLYEKKVRISQLLTKMETDVIPEGEEHVSDETTRPAPDSLKHTASAASVHSEKSVIAAIDKVSALFRSVPTKWEIDQATSKMTYATNGWVMDPHDRHNAATSSARSNSPGGRTSPIVPTHLDYKAFDRPLTSKSRPSSSSSVAKRMRSSVAAERRPKSSHGIPSRGHASGLPPSSHSNRSTGSAKNRLRTFTAKEHLAAVCIQRHTRGFLCRRGRQKRKIAVNSWIGQQAKLLHKKLHDTEFKDEATDDMTKIPPLSIPRHGRS